MVASRLADAATEDGVPWRVLILEAGAWMEVEDVAHPDHNSQKPEAWWPAVEVNWSLGEQGRSWKYATGRGIGGTASVNSMIYTPRSSDVHKSWSLGGARCPNMPASGGAWRRC